ncbi:hypothetical protein CALVIDRAFT_140436 [Calocera viscosa TUFC12733]|uniref:WKF domain-containing protein n=1 Tax=Calocera viscosa (strain TUFC12733) TaxID=1330018 RepID=A0A167M2W2_CALVF|nr:hypothetical protein CALVIDRAFT_140436 [Calocera viscosa TUFC12733]
MSQKRKSLLPLRMCCFCVKFLPPFLLDGWPVCSEDVLEVIPKTKKKSKAAVTTEDKTTVQPTSELSGTVPPSESVTDAPKKAKKRKESGKQTNEAEEIAQPPKKKKKSKEAEHAVVDEPVKTKKTKTDKAKSKEGGKETKTKKKKDKSKAVKSSLPDPKEDETLSDTAKKAINYTREYALSVADPPTPGWKFNKNSQTWLIKNVLDGDIVTDPYMDICFKYLRTVKGGALQQMEELCKSVIDAPAEAPATEGKEDKEGQEPLLQRYSKDRATTLLGLLQST